MSKSNPVHPWRLGRTRALIFTQKSLNRAKTGVPHGTPKNFPRLGRDVSTMRKTQSTKINRKINFILHGLATRRLSVKKKMTRNRDFSRPAETDPYDYFVRYTMYTPHILHTYTLYNVHCSIYGMTLLCALHCFSCEMIAKRISWVNIRLLAYQKGFLVPIPQGTDSFC